MKIQNVAVQLQLGESLIQFYTEHSLERQYFEGRYIYIFGIICCLHGNFFNIWTFNLRILCKNFRQYIHVYMQCAISSSWWMK